VSHITRIRSIGVGWCVYDCVVKNPAQCGSVIHMCDLKTSCLARMKEVSCNSNI
jgi:hypothetical protein